MKNSHGHTEIRISLYVFVLSQFLKNQNFVKIFQNFFLQKFSKIL